MNAPTIMTRLRHSRQGLPPTASRIAAFIEQHPHDVIRMSITELAEQTGASEGSVVGLCRRVGASGFQDLKIQLAGQIVEPIQFIQEDLTERDDFAKVRDRVFAAHANSLNDTRVLLTPESLTLAVDFLRRADRVEVYGVGSSAPVAEDLAYRLLQLGKNCKPVTDSHVQAVSASMTGPDVAIVTVSHSGSTSATVYSTRLAHEAGAKIIGITRLGKTPLARYCDTVLNTVANETRYRPEAMSSRMAQLGIIDALVSCYALSNAAKSIEKLQLSAHVLSEKRF
ncbi:MurR/RpiR family transcriptional regulator [Frigidibacter sp. ROC022]|uniref:MurR/RpiR family transcriptional regulator n=1 Tax=Frigidibacter sp. ROC022 TaxID=2971796 RepID=UPI00215A14BB|nr:MurR/RpiR family transcriptional regulator [Frigidibacter sp. ROC022]MCR8724679.1 MurR/RpiR family transcriptional regulator [Frigidibacter sp. ROC022]